MLKITHNAGFFSCCTIRLEDIKNYFNTHKKLPEIVDSSEQFKSYKQPGNIADMTPVFFDTTDVDIQYNKEIEIVPAGNEQQFTNYKLINYTDILPFVEKYFVLSSLIQENIKQLEKKYNIDYKDLCVVYYRGLGKSWETNISPYEEYINKAQEVGGKRFLIQTDESEFLDYASKSLSNSFHFSEMPTVSRNFSDSVPDVEQCLSQHDRIKHSINFLSIVKIMSKAKNVIVYSGNVSYWMCLFRGNASGVHQYLNQKEIIYGVRNKQYDPSKTDFWV